MHSSQIAQAMRRTTAREWVEVRTAATSAKTIARGTVGFSQRRRAASMVQASARKSSFSLVT